MNAFKLFLLLAFIAVFSFGQEAKIVKLLNEQFRSEQKMYEPYEEEKPEMIQPFQIENGILSFEFKYSGEGKETHFRRQVHLANVVRLDKDINVILISENDGVLETINVFGENQELISEQQIEHNMFFLEIRKEFGNEKFKNRLLKAFKSAGYEVSNEYWAD